MRPTPLYITYKALWSNMQPIKPITPGDTPSLYDKYAVSLYARYTTQVTNVFTSHPKDEASQFSILLKDTGVTTGT